MQSASNQRSRFVSDHLKVVFGSDGGAGLEGQVKALALDHFKVTFGEYLGDPQRSVGRRPVLGGAQQGYVAHRLKGVPGHQCLGHTPKTPHGGLVAALKVLVLDVIVDKGEVVDKFQRRGCGKRANRVLVQCLASEHAESWAQGLALGNGSPGGGPVSVGPSQMVTQQ